METSTEFRVGDGRVANIHSTFYAIWIAVRSRFSTLSCKRQIHAACSHFPIVHHPINPPALTTTHSIPQTSTISSSFFKCHRVSACSCRDGRQNRSHRNRFAHFCSTSSKGMYQFTYGRKKNNCGGPSPIGPIKVDGYNIVNAGNTSDARKVRF